MQHFTIKITLLACLLSACNLNDTSITPCVDGDIRGDMVCEGGKWVSMDVVDLPQMDMPEELVDLVEDLPSDLPDLFAKDMMSFDLDMAKDQSMDQACDHVTICQNQNVVCGVISDPICGDIDCDTCGMGGICEQNQCKCDVSTCGVQFCGSSTQNCGMLSCPAQCDWGQTCENNLCVPVEILSPTPQPNALFGHRIVRAENWLAISAPLQTVDSLTHAGVVEMYRRQNGRWNHVQTIKGSRADHYFGYDLDIKKNILVVGAPSSLPPGLTTTKNGQVYVYYLNNNRWAGVNVINGAKNTGFGMSVALVGDSGTILASQHIKVGEPHVMPGGAVHHYRCNFTSCSNEDTLIPREGTLFGSTLRFYDGITLIGHPKFAPTANTQDSGRVLIFDENRERIDGEMQMASQSKQLAGSSIAMTKGLAAVGAPQYSTGGTRKGRIFVYSDDLDDIPLALEPSPERAEFGTALALDEDYIFVGAPGQKAVYIYNAPSGNVMPGQYTVLISPGGTNGFGTSLLWDDFRKELLVGAPLAGRVFVYEQ